MRGDIKRFYAERRPLMLAVAGLLLINLSLRLVITPLSGSVERNEAELVKTQEELGQALGAWDKAARLKVLLETAEHNAANFYGSTLETRRTRFAEVDRELKSLAKQFDLDFTSISFKTEPLEEHGVEKFTASFPLKGGYQALRRFISHIEDSSQFLIIDGVMLADSSKKGSELNLQIQVSTYFALPPGERPSEEVRRRRA